ncbi:hypothetical protein SAMN02745947_02123 [Rhodococcus rhodochrous J3]|uniref:Uncharacterized protein n=2 Tax=Rhodococcus rhodochrous TaxID=1829 RepID=A0AA46WXK0_RHORH|nr:hypothetical protein [Rhodococcus rhodochrous]MBF4481473.1 hypothetical protein [Rhodococcus rhodochrous]MCB8912794.1 hypothetical protein [Rhodococcus rhodochrous]TWH52950.1 hypothetical protein L612_000200002670 [Rhodococcus rhodochrous J38]UZF46301.1 hypothetical protein KUM34_006390 [Rhodococcus rhodochrous]SMG31969.1 hypothetical protein SAMN02745947_02123 [Rhodococcus rhodochrous J3]
MNLANISFVLAGILLVLGVVLREHEVPATGSIGRSRVAWLISGALAVWVVVAAVQTLLRFGELAA